MIRYYFAEDREPFRGGSFDDDAHPPSDALNACPDDGTGDGATLNPWGQSG